MTAPSSVERSAVQWGNTRIAYTVVRSPRRGTVAVAVEPSGSVVLTAPRDTPLARLDRVVHQKAKWIVDSVRRRRNATSPTQREFVSGETVHYQGRSYRLAVRESGRPRAPSLVRGKLTIVVPGGLGENARALGVREQMVGWYRVHAQESLARRARAWTKTLAVTVDNVRITEQRMRWGSSSPSGVRLNWRIIQAPPSLQDYVIAHELTHIRHPHHGESFWAALGRVMPDYERRQRDLLHRGPSYVW